MKTSRLIAAILTIACSFSTINLVQAQEQQPTATEQDITTEQPSVEPNGFISDELFIYMHSGAGNNYRILGSINAGTPVTLTGEQKNGYTQIIDDKNRTAWVESKYVSEKPGLRYVVAELNSQIALAGEQESSINEQLSVALNKITKLESSNEQLSTQVQVLNENLTQTQSKLQSQDMDIKKEWFFNGAIVLVIGLLLGIILPHLAAKKRRNDSWG